jgi:glycosyltransferase involved in cell wall biosynthesis
MAYNEAPSLAATVAEVQSVMPDAEILVIDDGSSDATPAICADLSARVIRFPENRGLGEVYRTGFREAAGDWVTFWPADGQFPASILADFLPRMATHDMVLGVVPSGWLSVVERWLYRLLFGPMPRFQGVLMVRTAKVRSLPLVSEGRSWVVVMEMLIRARRAGWYIESRPTPLRPRTHGRSKVRSLHVIMSHLRALVALRRVLQ